MALRSALLVAGVAVSLVEASSNPCPAGSVPITECDFWKEGGKKCMKGVNTGAAAKPGGPCEVPRMENGCMLDGDQNTMAWLWKSKSIQNCCNCFPVESPCPLGSVPFLECDFHEPGGQPCLKGVNVGAAATSGDLCQAPTPDNGCMLEGDQSTMAWMWKSKNSDTRCCNCFMVAGAPSSLAQVDARATARLRRHGRSDGDASSMLQLPAEGADGDEEHREDL